MGYLDFFKTELMRSRAAGHQPSSATRLPERKARADLPGPRQMKPEQLEAERLKARSPQAEGGADIPRKAAAFFARETTSCSASWRSSAAIGASRSGFHARLNRSTLIYRILRTKSVLAGRSARCRKQDFNL